jgi:ADP-heptose:LPS heptosyltransferase/ubiquinone/menaquinone biosynthesis C-methylase UbiE
MGKERSYWWIKAHHSLPENFTGKWRDLEFVDGIYYAPTTRMAWFALFYGCTDITPPELVEARYNRDLKKILVCSYGGFGDTLLTTHAVKAIKEMYPNARVAAHASLNGYDMFKHNPYIDDLRKESMNFSYDLYGEYDDVIDWSFIIKHHTKADYINVQELTMKAAFIPEPWKPKDMKPILKFGKFESEKIFTDMEWCGITKNDTVIAIHGEASAFLRRLPYSMIVKLAYRLAAKKYKVILIGKEKVLENPIYTKCPNCGASITTPYPNVIRVPKLTLKCLDCGYEWEYHVEELPQNIFFSGMFASAPRDVCIMLSRCSGFVGCDSVFGHAAAALDIPSVLIYGSYHPVLRAKYYDKTNLLFRPLKCGPCHFYKSDCPVFDDFVPPCMTQYSVDEIEHLLEESMAGRITPETMKIRETELYISDSQSIGICPSCDEDEKLSVATYKGVFYVLCETCQAMYTYPEKYFVYDEEYLKYYRSKSCDELQVNEAREVFMNLPNDMPDNKMLEIGCGSGYFSRLFGDNGWNVMAIDKNSSAIEFCLHEHESIQSVYMDILQEAQAHSASLKDNSFDLIAMVDTLQQFRDHRELLEICKRLLKPGGYIYIKGAVTDGYEGFSVWPPMNVYQQGENRCIPSSKSLKTICEELGLVPRIMTDNQQGIMRAMIKKMGDK